MEARDMILEYQGIYKSFNQGTDREKVVLEDINISVSKNEFLVILGPGQCGKTTLLEIAAGLIEPTQGSVFLHSEEMHGTSQEVGMVFQNMATFTWKTVMQNVSLGGKINKVPKKQREEKARYFIDLVGLTGFENAYPHQLSGGMKQRVGIARAYANDPQVLLMDEPFGHLDAQTRYQMEEEILKIWEQSQRTIIFVTNNIEEAIFLGDRIIVLSNCPSQVKAEYLVDLDRLRNYTDKAFLALRKEITNNMDMVKFN